MPPSQKNSLSLRLTESAVFLRTRPGRYLSGDSQPSVLRGLLVLDLVKPTRISSIELQLKAKSHTTWPEGFGARRVDVTEEHTVFQTSVVYFRAGQDPIRRPTSVGPGVLLHNRSGDWDEDPHTSTSTAISHPPTRSPSRQGRHGSADGYIHRPHVEHYDEYRAQLPSYSSTMTPPMTSRATSPASSALHLSLSPATSSGERSRSPLPIVPELSARLLNEQQQSGVAHDENDRQSDALTRSSLNSITQSSHRDTSHERASHSRSRFSLASMSNAILDVMRTRNSGDEPSPSRGRLLEKGNALVVDQASQSRGRPLEKSVRDHERSTVSMLVDMLKSDHTEEHKKNGANWKEFKKGTYTYPISIPIPSDCPPTLRCDFGNVTWSLKGVVHRPGAFEPKLIAARDVIIVASPMDDDTEDTGGIIVERHWDQQLQYLISISGRSFYIGGTIPVSLTLMPLAKVKIHKILVYIEERIDYYTQMKRIARTEPLSRIVLLNIKDEGHNDHILPLESGDVNAFRNSPFYNLATQNDDLSEMASSLMGPGPWTFYQDLHLPHSCSYIHFTNKNRHSNIIITHTLKWTIRLERGDDLAINPKTGKRKLFDIVVQIPVNILSCRCNPEWTALPGYSDRLADPQAIDTSCPCHHKRLEQPGMFRRRTGLERVASTSSASSVEADPVDGSIMRSLRQGNPSLVQLSSQYERLVSGRETETGETPPAYEA